MDNPLTSITIRQLEKKFSSRIVFQDLNLEINPGELVLICGPNGAGKSTFLRLLAGLEKPDHGSIQFHSRNALVESHSRTGYLSHASNLYEELTPRENLSFFADIYRLKNAPQRIEELLDQVKLTSRQDDPVQFLSRGMVRRLAIGRAVLMQPEILLLDEPFSGIDFESQKALLPLLNQINQDGCTILITTHDHSLLDIQDFRLVVLNDKRLAYNGFCRSTAEADAIYKEVLAQDIPLQSPEEDVEIKAPGQDHAGADSKSKALSNGMGFGDYLCQAAAVFKKDLAAELRSREMINYMLLYALIALIIYSFAFNLMEQSAGGFIPGIIWTTLIFSGILGLSRLINREYRNAAMDILRIAPVEPSAIFLGKLGGMYVPLLFIALIVSLATWILFDVNIFTPGVLLTLVFGLFGFSCAGTIIATLSERTRVREILLPVLLLPLLIPLLMACVYMDIDALNGLALSVSSGWVRILVLYDLFILAAGLMTYDFVIND